MGNKIKFKAGEVIAEGSSSVVYKALNLEDGSFFVVKKYNSISDNKLITTFLVCHNLLYRMKSRFFRISTIQM